MQIGPQEHLVGLPVVAAGAGVAPGQFAAQLLLAQGLVQRCLVARVLAGQFALGHQQGLLQRQQHRRRIAAQRQAPRQAGLGIEVVEQILTGLGHGRGGQGPGEIALARPRTDAPLVFQQGVGVLDGGQGNLQPLCQFAQ